VWVSPHDHSAEVVELLGELGVGDHATVFVATVREGPGWPALVARGWDLSRLGQRYEAFGSEFEPYLRSDSSLADREAFEVRTRMTHAFRAFVQLDPELPDELAPLSGPRSRAAHTFEALYTGLAAASQRHFDAVTRESSEQPRAVASRDARPQEATASASGSSSRSRRRSGAIGREKR
jgi:phenylacetic acid degradation operon negative regulatory protein